MKKLNIALVGHDNRKHELLELIGKHADVFKHHKLYGTGTTGRLIHEKFGFEVVRLKSGPLGGDQELGALIANGDIDALFFFWDPMNPQPHEPDVRALLRISVLNNIIIAEDRHTADLILTSPLFASDAYHKEVMDYSEYINRKV